ncbi:MAG: hypothetical protein AAGH87_04655 [Pseudomonadota bacterium]
MGARHSNTATTTAALLALAACGAPGPVEPDPIVGGPCAYETSIVEATAVAVDADGVRFETAGGELFAAASELPALPAVGETMTLQVERITQGTCTPEIITLVE